jgi:hypothetical protein
LVSFLTLKLSIGAPHILLRDHGITALGNGAPVKIRTVSPHSIRPSYRLPAAASSAKSWATGGDGVEQARNRLFAIPVLFATA